MAQGKDLVYVCVCLCDYCCACVCVLLYVFCVVAAAPDGPPAANVRDSSLFSRYVCFQPLVPSTHATGVLPGQRLIKIDGKDVSGLDNTDIAVLMLGAPGMSSKHTRQCQ